MREREEIENDPRITESNIERHNSLVLLEVLLDIRDLLSPDKEVTDEELDAALASAEDHA